MPPSYHSLRDFLSKAVKFGVVGVSSIGVYFVLLYLLRPLIDPIWLLTGLAYIGSMVFNYLCQSLFTFQVRARNNRMLGRYISLHAGCMAFNSTAMFVLVDVLALNLWLGQVCVTFCVITSSFMISKYWVFVET